MQSDSPSPPALARRQLCLAGLGSLGALGLGGCASAPVPQPAAADQVQAFSGERLGAVPDRWHTYALRKDVPHTHYQVETLQGQKVLYAHARSSVSGLRCAVHVDPSTRRHLDFSWLVQDVPARGNVAVPEEDDCPARVIVAFGGDETRLSLRDRLFYEQVELFTGQRLPYATLMYVWDGGSNPTEAIVRNHRTSRIQYLVVDSGPAGTSQWRRHRRDLVADFQRAFGEAPGPITSVGVLTDGDATKAELQAWYGDIRLEA